MLSVMSALIVAGALVWGAQGIVRELRSSRVDAERGRALSIVSLFAAGRAAATADPRALLVWQPLAAAARELCPAEFAGLDRASGGTFPFAADQIRAAHDQWTAEWLAWERSHDADYKLKAAIAERELAESGGASIARGKLDAVEREKLDLYQRRYSEYVRTAKALQALMS
jgi:hypothetical protein